VVSLRIQAYPPTVKAVVVSAVDGVISGVTLSAFAFVLGKTGAISVIIRKRHASAHVINFFINAIITLIKRAVLSN
jgi:hypothetical protein